jgi:membrane protein YqaA with SNARE-associated domain
MTGSHEPATSAPLSSFMSPWRLILSTLLVIVGLVGAVALVGYYFREPLLRISRSFVDTLGGLGVTLGFFLPDAFTIPLPNDVVSVLGLAGGMSFFEVTCWASAGSLAGGTVGYWIGRYLRTTRFVQRVLSRGGGIAQQILSRYGVTAVAIAAITPLPYSIFCWAAGAGKLPFQTFLAVSAPLRVIRVAGYLYLIQLGLLSSLI